MRKPLECYFFFPTFFKFRIPTCVTKIFFRNVFFHVFFFSDRLEPIPVGNEGNFIACCQDPSNEDIFCVFTSYNTSTKTVLQCWKKKKDNEYECHNNCVSEMNTDMSEVMTPTRSAISIFKQNDKSYALQLACTDISRHEWQIYDFETNQVNSRSTHNYNKDNDSFTNQRISMIQDAFNDQKIHTVYSDNNRHSYACFDGKDILK